jgi:hypothetical protein
MSGGHKGSPEDSSGDGACSHRHHSYRVSHRFIGLHQWGNERRRILPRSVRREARHPRPSCPPQFFRPPDTCRKVGARRGRRLRQPFPVGSGRTLPNLPPTLARRAWQTHRDLMIRTHLPDHRTTTSEEVQVSVQEKTYQARYTCFAIAGVVAVGNMSNATHIVLTKRG